MWQDIFFTYLLLINIIALVMYGIDKKKARKQKWRIKESTLMAVAFLGGCYGALAGMYLFHHKTKKNKFKWGVPLITILYTLLIGRIFL